MKSLLLQLEKLNNICKNYISTKCLYLPMYGKVSLCSMLSKVVLLIVFIIGRKANVLSWLCG